MYSNEPSVKEKTNPGPYKYESIPEDGNTMFDLNDEMDSLIVDLNSKNNNPAPQRRSIMELKPT